MKFKKPYIYNALEGMNFQSFTEIQKKIIPDALKGRDVIGVSETGSGKTHAFLLPIFDALLANERRVQALILAPTRELAEQILKMARELAKYTSEKIDIRIYPGGRDRDREIERLKKSQPQVVVGTPGKVHDLAVKENLLKIHTAKTLVIDEADMALEIGFMNDLEAIAYAVGKEAQLMVFSATFPDHLRAFIRKSMHQPLEVVLNKKRLAGLDIRHRFIKAAPENRLKTLDKVLAAINPYLALIFANTKEDVELIASHLHQKDLDATYLHGDLRPRERKQVLRDIAGLNVQYVVASDMASRGIDIEGVSHVVNFAFPKDMNFYIHRVGRTARMGHSGTAITFYDDADEKAFDFLKKEDVMLDFCDVVDRGFVSKKSEAPVKEKRQKPKDKVKKVKPAYKKKYHAKQKRKRGN